MEHVRWDPLDQHLCSDLSDLLLLRFLVTKSRVESHHSCKLGWPFGGHSQSDGCTVIVAADQFVWRIHQPKTSQHCIDHIGLLSFVKDIARTLRKLLACYRVICSHEQDLIAAVQERRDLMSYLIKTEAQVDSHWVRLISRTGHLDLSKRSVDFQGLTLEVLKVVPGHALLL